MNFMVFKAAVAKQFAKMQKYELYTVSAIKEDDGNPRDVIKDVLWEVYQTAFPKGANEVFRERPQHDCQCCKSFIRTIGNVVALIDGKMVSIWDVELQDEPIYQQVADKMAAFIKSRPIDDKFLHYAAYAGTDFSLEDMDGAQHKWDHFHAVIDKRFVMDEDKIGAFLSDRRGIRDVFDRGLQTISIDSIDTVIDLLAQGSLYRGDEKESNLLRFREAVVAYQAYEGPKQFFVLNEVEKLHASIAKMRNSSMGKLLISISEGEDLEVAVKAYEKIMAPENYKRSSAVITQGMKDKAQKFVDENGLESALHRRHAKPTDITVVNTLFANRKAKSLMSGSIFDDVDVKKSKQDFSKVEEVDIDTFLTKILPQAESLELYVENDHFGKLMSLTAPIYEDAKPILKWDNNFCWSYRGEVTDSIKEKVKAAGGVVDADLCCRLAWYNTDDLDLHMHEPGDWRINFSERYSRLTGGQLDVDMNSPMSQKTRTPVENIFYKDRSKMKEGTYKLMVNQYQLRERTDVGFEVNIDFMGQVYKFVYDKSLPTGKTVLVAEFKYTHAKGVQIVESLPYTEKSMTEWGVTSQSWVPVNMVMLSPNYWDDNATGNKHWFFILDKCLNPEPVRGFYNEFLRQEFWEHRKTFEVLASKIKAPPAAEQLSGLGFSSTQRAHIMCKVSGAFNRVIKIAF